MPGTTEKEEEGRDGKMRVETAREHKGSIEEVPDCGCRAPGWRSFIRDTHRGQCCPQGSAVPGHSTGLCINTAEGGLWGCVLPSFLASEALKRHTQGHIADHIPFSINDWEERCIITVGEFTNVHTHVPKPGARHMTAEEQTSSVFAAIAPNRCQQGGLSHFNARCG